MNSEILEKKIEILIKKGSFKEIDSIKKQSLYRHDALAYYLSCEALGFREENLESLYLFNRGLKIQTDNKIQIKPQDKNYEKFLNEIKDIPIQDFIRCSDEKRKALIKYFPKKFDHNSKQDLRKYKDMSIGVIFNKIVNYAHSRIYGG